LVYFLRIVVYLHVQLRSYGPLHLHVEDLLHLQLGESGSPAELGTYLGVSRATELYPLVAPDVYLGLISAQEAKTTGHGYGNCYLAYYSGIALTLHGGPQAGVIEGIYETVHPSAVEFLQRIAAHGVYYYAVIGLEVIYDLILVVECNTIPPLDLRHRE